MEIGFDWEKAFLMEQKVAHLISQQSKHGCNFNLRDAHWHIHSLTEKIILIDHELVPLLPPMFHKGNEYKAPFKLNGKPKAFVQKYMDKAGLTEDVVSGPFTAVEWTPFDTSKSAKVKAVMLDLGWVPTEWNSKKMPFNVWSYRKKLERMSFAKFINTECDEYEREEYLVPINAFIEKHFKNKSKGYMQAVLSGIGFDLEKATPTFDTIKKKLLLNPFWITSPKITEDSFDSVSEENGRAMVLLKQRMIYAHRRSLIAGLIDLVRKDGKISGDANSCATPTARMRHSGIVNIPAAGSVYGEQCRHLFIADFRDDGRKPILISRLTDPSRYRRVPNTNLREELDKGKWVPSGHATYLIPKGQDAFVGGDGAGLELRMLTHYLISVSKQLLAEAEEEGDKQKIAYYQRALDSAYEYREVLLHGDIHSHNQRLAGLPTRKSAKTFIYAFLYGAGDANLGGQLGEGREKGAELRARFLAECPCIPVLIEWIQDFAKKNGWVPAIDGRKLVMRRDENGQVMAHKALNTLLQAAGSIVMKYAGCYLDNWNKRDKLDCHQVIMMHDEYQFTCKWEHVEKLRENIDACVRQAGIFLKMDCPLASDSIVGASWLHTH